jgi:putative chitinase
MTTAVTLSQVLGLAPNAQRVYRDAFDQYGQEQLDRYAITDSPLRVAHFMAQILHETDGLVITTESLYYTHANRLMAVWPKRFASAGIASRYLRNPALLANTVYGGRMGNTQDGDGWRFIGRGLLQITGRDSYAKYGAQLGIDLVALPMLAYSPEHAIELAAAEFVGLGCLPLADADDVEAVTRAVNGGTVGLHERELWLAQTKAVWPRT